MKYLSVCSGIDAATQAWHPLGWQPVAFSEIEKFPSAVLAHHYPSVPNWGDMIKFKEWPDEPIDLLVGGTPCQDNSIGYAAGAKKCGDGLDGERSGLAFSFVGIVEQFEPDWIVWENVPNVLAGRHSKGFLRFAADLTDCGYHVAWRVLDQRRFGPSDQPRPRLFVVGNRDPRRAAAVLLEPESYFGNSPERSEAAPVLTARGGMAFDDRTPCILDQCGPRIATPDEWEVAMGFPAGFTQIPWRGKPSDQCPDGPRYKAVGNSMAVNVMAWIGERIAKVDAMEAAE